MWWMWLWIERFCPCSLLPHAKPPQRRGATQGGSSDRYSGLHCVLLPGIRLLLQIIIIYLRDDT